MPDRNPTHVDFAKSISNLNDEGTVPSDGDEAIPCTVESSMFAVRTYVH